MPDPFLFLAAQIEACWRRIEAGADEFVETRTALVLEDALVRLEPRSQAGALAQLAAVRRRLKQVAEDISPAAHLYRIEALAAAGRAMAIMEAVSKT